MQQRPRRNRRSASIRGLIAETVILPQNLIMPLFVISGSGQREAVVSMPGIDRLSVDLLVEEAQTLYALGIPAVALFPSLPDALKDARASESVNPDGLLPQAVKAIKNAVPKLAVITDVAMDPYSSDGHDGYVRDGHILNDETLPILADMALTQARAGADFVAPSDMMDGRVGYIRRALDAQGFTDVGIISYAAKYASAFYGPFRDALSSAPKSGDKKTYQMDPANVREALREVLLDVAEGADVVMIKPGLPYLDVIRTVRETVSVPVAAYQVSGEYAMIKAAAQNGWIDGPAAMKEALVSLKRAGADMIFTYFAKEFASSFKTVT
jgi:porphobilinogen synthase